jgi:hypothetical protein
MPLGWRIRDVDTEVAMIQADSGTATPADGEGEWVAPPAAQSVESLPLGWRIHDVDAAVAISQAHSGSATPLDREGEWGPAVVGR